MGILQEIRSFKMLNKDAKKFNLKDGLDRWIIMTFLWDVVFLVILLIVAFLNDGLNGFSFALVLKVVGVLMAIFIFAAFFWTLILAYVKYRRSIKDEKQV